jgi:hypothetical protein
MPWACPSVTMGVQCMVSLVSKAMAVIVRGGLLGCEMLRIPHCLDSRLTVNCEILATCSSTYSPVCTHRKPIGL